MADELLQRTPPQSQEAEQAVLGSMLMDTEVITDIVAILQADDFYQRSHQLIFSAIEDLTNAGEGVDFKTVAERLRNTNMLENAGGMDYLVQLVDYTPTAANAEYYAKTVEEKSVLRKLIRAANEITRESYEEQDDVERIIEDAERSVLSVSERRNRAGFKHISNIVMQNVDTIEELSKNQQDVTGIPTGYPDLDKMTAGLQPDQLVILAARPAVGKTAFALNIAQNIATKQNGTVAIFSLEMGAESLVNRMLCAEGSIDASRLRTGQLEEQEWSDLIVAMGALGESNIFIDDTPGIRVAEIRAKARRLKQEQKSLDLIVIDYLQLIEGSGKRSDNRQQEVSEISRQLKKIAKELEVPVVALSQLSRGVEQRQDKRPVLSDIRESGSIEQDADIVAFLYREDYYRSEDGEEDNPEADNNIVEVIIEKNRSGKRGTVKLIFTKEFNKFSSVSFRDDADMFA